MSVCVEKIVESPTKNVWRYGLRAENGRDPVEDEYRCVMEPVPEKFLTSERFTLPLDEAFEYFLGLASRYSLTGAFNMCVAGGSDIGAICDFVRRIKREFPEVK